jgi:hypothetical protein
MRPRLASQDMQAVLTHVAGPLEEDKLKEITDLLRDPEIHAAYVRCTWWGGCYYCQDETGSWHLVYCYAEPDITPYRTPLKRPGL